LSELDAELGVPTDQTEVNSMCGAVAGGPDLAGIDVDTQAVVQGVVLHPDDTPVTPAYVRLLDPSGEFTAEVPVSGTGQFRFFAAPGSWTLRVLAPGAVPLDRRVVASLGAPVDLTLVLPNESDA